MNEVKRKVIGKGDWVRVYGQPGTEGAYIGIVRAITDDDQLIIGEGGNYSIVPFEYCTRIAPFEEYVKLESLNGNKPYKSWGR